MDDWDPTAFQEARRSKGLTQLELSKLLGVSVPTVARWESTGDNASVPRGYNRRAIDEWMASDDLPERSQEDAANELRKRIASLQLDLAKAQANLAQIQGLMVEVLGSDDRE